MLLLLLQVVDDNSGWDAGCLAFVILIPVIVGVKLLSGWWNQRQYTSRRGRWKR